MGFKIRLIPRDHDPGFFFSIVAQLIGYLLHYPPFGKSSNTGPIPGAEHIILQAANNHNHNNNNGGGGGGGSGSNSSDGTANSDDGFDHGDANDSSITSASSSCGGGGGGGGGGQNPSHSGSEQQEDSDLDSNISTRAVAGSPRPRARRPPMVRLPPLTGQDAPLPPPPPPRRPPHALRSMVYQLRRRHRCGSDTSSSPGSDCERGVGQVLEPVPEAPPTPPPSPSVSQWSAGEEW
ncbi:hypothetical protein VTI74DRAFT_4703 [Chaetomium olivicolor]